MFSWGIPTGHRQSAWACHNADMMNSDGPLGCGGGAWASHLEFSGMTRAASHEIADNWKYPAPFDFYDATADPEDYDEFVTPDLWPEVFQQVRFSGALIGFFAAQPVCEGAACEISLGLRPDLTGKGAGQSFLNAGLTWLGTHGYPPRTVLSVAAFNTRAIKVYQAAGFTKAREFPQETNGGVYDFIEMERGLPDLE